MQGCLEGNVFIRRVTSDWVLVFCHSSNDGAWQCSPIPCIPGSEATVNLTPVSTELGFEFKTVV